MGRIIGRARSVLRLVRDLSDAAVRRNVMRTIAAYKAALPYQCPCCGYEGRFDIIGILNHFNCKCPGCGSLPRQRLLYLATRDGWLRFGGRDVLHFAPEAVVAQFIQREGPRSYLSADAEAGRAERVVDIESPDLPNAGFDVIVCSHVLEHVDDGLALAAFHRILRPGGDALLMIPIFEGLERTYENSKLRTAEERLRYFDQADHVRAYGRDFRERVVAAGFRLEEYVAGAHEAGIYGLTKGERIFRASRLERSAGSTPDPIS